MNAKFEAARKLVQEAVAEEYNELIDRSHNACAVSLQKLVSDVPTVAHRENMTLFYQVGRLMKLSGVLRKMYSVDPTARTY